MKGKWKAGLFLILGGMLAVKTGRNLWRLYQTGGRLKEAQQQFEAVKAKNEELKKRLAEVNTPEFVEREARDKLGYGKEGEVILILPKQEEKSSFAKATADKPNWRRWWDLYVGI